jgi:hypothetical protein
MKEVTVVNIIASRRALLPPPFVLAFTFKIQNRDIFVKKNMGNF